MDLILISSAGLCTGALAADHFGRRRVLVTAFVRGASGGPAGLASEIGPAGPSVGEGAPTSRRSRREVGPASGRPAPRNGLGIGPSPSALRRQRRAVVRSPPACRALALVIRGRGMERPLTHQPVRGAASRRAWPRRKGAKAHAGRR